jgi:pimeloyl-ACP methyl ester carboxylesterase
MTIEVVQWSRRLVRGLLRVGLRALLWLCVITVVWGVANALRAFAIERATPEHAASGVGRWLTAHDVQLHVVEHGDPQAPLLVLTAGTGAWAGTWRDSIEPLVRAGWRVVAIDLPPFGFSHRPPNGEYTRRAQAQRLIGVLRQLDSAPVVLLGHSYGGGPAAEAAMLQPSLVRHLILVDAAIGLRKPDAAPCAAPGVVIDALRWRPLRTSLVSATGTQPLLTGVLLRGFVARKDVITEDRLSIYREPLAVRGTSAAIGDWALQFASECDGSLSMSVAGFAALRMPLSLLWGDLDTVTPLQQARDIVAAAPGARLVVLPGVGHIPQIEDAPLFNARLVELLHGLLPKPKAG